MDTVVALLGRLQSGFGKSFFFSGILPALVLLLGSLWAIRGGTWTALDELLSIPLPANSKDAPNGPKAGNEPTAKNATATEASRDMDPTPLRLAGNVSRYALITVVLAAGLYQTRRLLLMLYQLMWPRCLSDALVRIKLWQLHRAEQQREQANVKYTCMLWAIPPFGERFEQPKYGLDQGPVETLSAVLEKSREARSSLTTAVCFSQILFKKLAAGLEALYYSSNALWNEPNYKAELTAWKTALNSAHADRKLDYLRMAALQCKRKVQREHRRIQRQFPSAAWMMPTDFGNRMAVLDDYAERRYGVCTTTLLLRLWGVLSKEEKEEITDAQIGTESMVVLSAAFYLTFVIAAACSVVESAKAIHFGSPVFDFPAVVRIAGSLVGGVAFYFAAIHSVASFSERVIRVVDLHYLDLIKALGIKAPETFKDACAMLENLSEFFETGHPRYDFALEKQPKNETTALGAEAPDFL